MTANHGAGECVGYKGATVNSIENFWRHLKCSITGTHVSVSPKYLGTYAKEFEYRFNRRDDAASILPELLFDVPGIAFKARLRAFSSPAGALCLALRDELAEFPGFLGLLQSKHHATLARCLKAANPL